MRPCLRNMRPHGKIPCVGGGSPDTNAYLRAKLKVSVFENGQTLNFWQKNFFFGETNFFTPINKKFVFLKKKHFPFFEKKCFFWKCFFDNFFFQNFQNFSAYKKFVKNFFEKTFPKKTFFFKKTNFLFIGVKKFVSPKKKFFCQKLSVRFQKRTLSTLLLNKHWCPDSPR